MNTNEGTTAPTFTVRHGKIPAELVDLDFFGERLAGRTPYGWWVSDIDPERFEDMSVGYIDPHLLVPPGTDHVDVDVMSVYQALFEFEPVVAGAARRLAGYEFELKVAGWTPTGGEDEAHVPQFVRVENIVTITAGAGRETRFTHLHTTEVDQIRADFFNTGIITVKVPQGDTTTRAVRHQHFTYFRHPSRLDHITNHYTVTTADLFAAAKRRGTS